MATEDFTFPIVSDASCPRFLDSPPLWRASSTTATSTNTSGHQEEEGDDGGRCSASKPADHPRRKSFSCVDGSEDDDGEDKMDMLWEDFNEELHNQCSSEEKAVKVRCVPGMAAASSTTGGAVVAARRAASLLMFMKMLRKLFQLHHSHPSRKANAL